MGDSWLLTVKRGRSARGVDAAGRRGTWDGNGCPNRTRSPSDFDAQPTSLIGRPKPKLDGARGPVPGDHLRRAAGSTCRRTQCNAGANGRGCAANDESRAGTAFSPAGRRSWLHSFRAGAAGNRARAYESSRKVDAV